MWLWNLKDINSLIQWISNHLTTSLVFDPVCTWVCPGILAWYPNCTFAANAFWSTSLDRLIEISLSPWSPWSPEDWRDDFLWLFGQMSGVTWGYGKQKAPVVAGTIWLERLDVQILWIACTLYWPLDFCACVYKFLLPLHKFLASLLANFGNTGWPSTRHTSLRMMTSHVYKSTRP